MRHTGGARIKLLPAPIDPFSCVCLHIFYLMFELILLFKLNVNNELINDGVPLVRAGAAVGFELWL